MTQQSGHLHVNVVNVNYWYLKNMSIISDFKQSACPGLHATILVHGVPLYHLLVLNHDIHNDDSISTQNVTMYFKHLLTNKIILHYQRSSI